MVIASGGEQSPLLELFTTQPSKARSRRRANGFAAAKQHAMIIGRPRAAIEPAIGVGQNSF
jgi:hypothetical protein